MTFTTSCGSASQPQFNRAVALLHSFQFANSLAAFTAVLTSDPSCSMAYWGIALSNWGNPFISDLKSKEQLNSGLQAVEKGRASHPSTGRERAYIEAVALLFTATASSDQRSRKLAYESAMAGLSAAYPQDTEAAIFYALAIAAVADPADQTHARQLQAGQILERLYLQYPDHPGLAHYIIHAYDVSTLAPRAAEAARHYAEIAPSSPHALHMPSHTFTRLGDWQASIDANLPSAAAAQSSAQWPDALHAYDYMAYAYLQSAQDDNARSLVESTRRAFAKFDPKVQITGAGSPSTAYFARAAVPARYDLERRAWADAANLEPLPSPFPFTDAITYFARGLGAAHLKQAGAARSAIDSLARCREQLSARKEGYWSGQVEIQRQKVAAWLMASEGQSGSALAAMRRAADLEDGTEKSVVTPGPLAPARELLGELLLQSNRPAEAFKEFESSLVKEPNRFWSLYGAAKAAKMSGDHKNAQRYFRKLLKVAQRGDQPGRRELGEARSEVSPL